ncbi:putative glycolipid-binding domain-containing protein [Methylobacterium sp. ID0610]|uniref:putative glycolipid-binding domain-containing protein n=1 Tax=Methylobacterium carpenticola TaxID=3344827 RepID=UPI0036BDF25C
MDRVVRWAPATGSGLEHLQVRDLAGGDILAESVVVGERDGLPFGLSYRLRCDPDWCVREAVVARVGGPVLHLIGDGAGRWTDGDGRPLPALDGCRDIDIAATPFTNTLPIRRLRRDGRLDERGAAEAIRVVYVPVPDLAPRAVDQRYTCLEPGRLYRYEGLFRGFAGDLPVDEDGLVRDYPGTFRRLDARA